METAVEELLPEKRSGLLVDYGCGNMPYRSLFASRLITYVGFDFPGNTKADGNITDGGALPLEDSQADFVLSTQVLEHSSDPSMYLSECRRVLKDGGYLILSTHGVWRYHPDPGDYWRWTSQGLRKTISDAGFEIHRFRGVMGPGATALQLWQDSVLTNLHWRLVPGFSFLMQGLIRSADRRCPEEVRNADACVYFSVSRNRKH
jgi:SAM-dependent methyltransferase